MQMCLPWSLILLFCFLNLTSHAGDLPKTTSAAIKNGSFTVMTFNTGTTETKARGKSDSVHEYGKDDAKISDEYYGNGLSWKKAVTATARFFNKNQPDIIAFQEIFHTHECAQIPEEARREFVCEDFELNSARSVARLILGDGYQVACHQGSKEKCLAVKKSFGQFRGCNADECLDFLDGQIIAGCGGHSRIARVIIDRVEGEPITVSHIYGTSGLSGDDASCRKKQFRKVFKNWGDGSPGANGERNIILGDFNTDPRRMFWFDKSAKELRDLIKAGPYRLISGRGENKRATYAGIVSLDHVLSDFFTGSCISPGISKKTKAVFHESYFDHVPTLCTLQ